MTLVRIIGNAPSAANYIYDGADCVHIALNLAPLLLIDQHVSNLICWIQDWRFFEHKGEEYFDDRFNDMKFAVTDDVKAPSRFTSVDQVPLLGRHGFSGNPEYGIYEGYTAAYGALQYALTFEPTRIELYGVDLTYGLRAVRFYQNRIGWDQDLHVHGHQLSNMRNAIDILQNDHGVAVTFETVSLVDRFALATAR